MRSLFTEHPASVDETYTEHLGVAFGFSLRMCLGGLACLVHAFLPFLFVNTGSGVPGRPSMGAWLSYGIGSEANDLPSFVVLKSGGSLSGGAAMWDAGFLPSVHQGVPFRSQGEPILPVANPAG